MILGALAAGEYFGGEIKRLAESIYAEMNWRWFTNPETNHPYLACFPEDLPATPPANMTPEGLFGG
jgi:hypothetical protein